MDLRPAAITACVAAFLAFANRMFLFVVTQPYASGWSATSWFNSWLSHSDYKGEILRVTLLQTWASTLLAISLVWFFLAVYLDSQDLEAVSAHG
jgi:hypothetical protein